MSALPKPPAHFDAAAGRLWRKVLSVLDERGDLRSEYLEPVEIYVENVVQARRLRAQIKEPMVRGSQGQPVANPMFDLVRRHENDAARLAGELLLTPRSRKRAGLAESVGDDLEDLLA